MRYRSLGQTGLRVSEIGFGCWGIGGLSNGASSYGPTDDHESKQALRRAFELGVTFFDTSDIYGYGHSEDLIGEALGDVRQKIVLASKVGFLEHGGPQDFSPKHIRRALEESLRRLRSDYIDLYQLHSPPSGLLEEKPEIQATLAALTAEGKIRVAGISARSPNDGLFAVEKFGFRSVQVNFNLTDQRALESGLFDACENTNAGVIARTPLCFGFLTGLIEKGHQFESFDHRGAWPKEQRDKWAAASRIFSAAATEGQTPAQFALRYCLSFPCVASVIPGMLNSSQVMENVQASEIGILGERALAEISVNYQKEDFFVGKKIQ